MEERWRAITEYPDYEVSDQWRVRRLTTRTSTRSGKILSVAALRAGYPSVDLCRAGTRKTHLVHRVVAGAFLGPCPPGHEVNHINGSKRDARAGNLEYVTSTQNQHHAYRSGLQSAAGEKNGQAKLTAESAGRIREMVSRPDRPSYAAIGRMYGVNEGTVRAVVSGKTWRVP